jgi:hypothetical protein
MLLEAKVSEQRAFYDVTAEVSWSEVGNQQPNAN